MKNDYVEIHLLTAVDAGDLLGLIDGTGCLGAHEKNEGLCLYWPSELWCPEMLRMLGEALRQLGDQQAVNTMKIVDLPDYDWNERWAASLQPIGLGRRILVRQSWNSGDVPPGGFDLVIDPKRAFGTGYHATTQLIAEWLEELVCGRERLLDVGTGSGILAMVALRLGAGSALGIDNDPEAIECAREYASINGFGPELQLRVAALEDLCPESYDLVLANLDCKTLLRYLVVLRTYLRSTGTLLISGLQQGDYPEIAEALAAAGWQVRGRRERDDWLALALREALQGTEKK